MGRYTTRQIIADDDGDHWFRDGDTLGDEVEVSNEDKPTGILDAQGNMIWRLKERVGF